MLSGAEEEVGKVWTVERDRQIDRKKGERDGKRREGERKAEWNGDDGGIYG